MLMSRIIDKSDFDVASGHKSGNFGFEVFFHELTGGTKVIRVNNELPGPFPERRRRRLGSCVGGGCRAVKCETDKNVTDQHHAQKREPNNIGKGNFCIAKSM